MIRNIALFSAAALLAAGTAAISHDAPAINDAQIAHIAYTAGQIDIDAANQALAKTHNPQVRDFAQTMVRDHAAVNDKALALVKALGVTPEANATSKALSDQAAVTKTTLAALNGAAFDKAYVRNEVAYHQTVNDALGKTLIPDAKNGQLKALLQTGLALFREHQAHAEHLLSELH